MPHPTNRAQRRVLARRRDGRIDHRQQAERRCGIEKDWKKLYWRRNKLHRARQIGRIWPYREWEKLMKEARLLNVLFVCSRNRLRSPTGEAVFSDMPGIATRSAGTARDAVRQVSMSDIRWADLVLCMEDKHANRLRADFRQAVAHKVIGVLSIPDDYKFMQEELVALLRERVMPFVRAEE